VGALFALALAGPAVGHEEVPGVTNVLDGLVPPAPDGVTVQVTRSVADQMVVENTTSSDLEVLDSAGRPFLRIGPRGVEGDLASAEWARSNAPGGGLVRPDPPIAVAPSMWVQVSTEPTWGWFDHRLHRVALATPPDVAAGDTVELERWQIPMRIGGRPLVARGRRLFSRPAGSFRHEITSQIEGVEASVLDGKVPAIFLRAVGEAPDLTLLGIDGELFVRLGPGGAEVNEASPTWALSARSRGGFMPDGPIGPGTQPRWRRENSAAQLTWLEPRAVPDSEGEDVAWSVPGRAGAESASLRGRSIWVPADNSQAGAARLPWVNIAGLAGLVVLLGLAARWTRRGRDLAAHSGKSPPAQQRDG